MKKTMLYLIAFCVCLYAVKVDVYAYNQDVLPGGDNYLSYGFFAFDGPYFTSDGPFLIKPYTEYTFSVSETYLAQFSENDIVTELEFFHYETVLGKQYVYLEDFVDSGTEGVKSIHFTSPSNGTYLSLAIMNINNYFDTHDFSSFILEEGSVFDGFEDYIEGTITDTQAPSFTSTGTIYSFVHNPISIDDILSSLSAYDSIDGDVTSRIVLVQDQYTINQGTIGLYQAVFSVTDLSGNETQTTVNIQVVDIQKPTISQTESVRVSYPNVLSNEEILTYLHASDAYDGDISSSIILTDDQYHLNSSIVGIYYNTYQVSDSSGNTETYVLEITVEDNEYPVFTGVSSLVTGYDTFLTEEYILGNIQVSDNYDDSTLLVITKVSDTYSANFHLLGTYEVTLQTQDSSGNVSQHTIQIEVVDLIQPMIYMNFDTIQIYTDSVLSLSDITNLFRQAQELNWEEEYQVSVLFDSYSSHYREAGTYHMSIRYLCNNGDTIDKNIQIVVKDRSDNSSGLPIIIPSDEGPNFIEKHREWFIGGVFIFVLIITNTIWAVLFKKK